MGLVKYTRLAEEIKWGGGAGNSKARKKISPANIALISSILTYVIPVSAQQ